MAKLTKSALKNLVKECLVEILSEGIQVDAESKGYSQKRRNIDPESNYPPRSSALDSIQFGQQTKRNEMFEKNTENAVRNMTEDPILSSILKDTAKTTLQEQRSAEMGRPGSGGISSGQYEDYAASAASSNSPEELFGESASKWAHLAFAEKKS